MRAFRTCIAVLVGVIFGFGIANVIHPRQNVKAGGGPVYVKQVNTNGASYPLGGSVVGFACTSNAGEPECYVATQ